MLKRKGEAVLLKKIKKNYKNMYLAKYVLQKKNNNNKKT